MRHVYSRLANSVTYTSYSKGGGDIPRIEKKVLVNGGAGIASKNLVTPQGVVTTVSDEDAEFLENDHHFRNHQKNGFVTISDKKHEVEKVVADMGEVADESSPLTPADYHDAEEKGLPVPSDLKENSKIKTKR